MQETIHFETTIESGIIRVPEQYIKSIPPVVMVTLAPVSDAKIMLGKKAQAGVLSPNDFTAMKIDTRNWRFDREQANERR